MQIFKETALYKIETGHTKLRAKGKLIKQFQSYSYQMGNNDRLIKAYSSFDKSIEKGRDVENPYIQNLLKKTKAY